MQCDNPQTYEVNTYKRKEDQKILLLAYIRDFSVLKLENQNSSFRSTHADALDCTFQLIPILHLQVMCNYVHWYCSNDCCVE